MILEQELLLRSLIQFGFVKSVEIHPSEELPIVRIRLRGKFPLRSVTIRKLTDVISQHELDHNVLYDIDIVRAEERDD